MFSVIFMSIFLAFPLISSEVIITQQPKEVYSLGDTVSVPVKIVAAKDSSDFLNMEILCDGLSKNFPQGLLQLNAGEEESRTLPLPLEKKFIEEMSGNCVIKVSFENSYALTKEFKVSNLINVESKLSSDELSPGDYLVIEGSSVKENEESAQGFIEASLVMDGSKIISQKDTVNNGFFKLNLTIPKNLAAGSYNVVLEVYERNNDGEKSNRGSENQIIEIVQVPSDLELFLDSRKVKAGEKLRAKAILYDQSGEKIPSTVSLILKNNLGKVIEEVEIESDRFFEYEIAGDELPLTWEVSAKSNGFETNSVFEILENKEIEMELVDRTLTIANIGNVLYDGTAKAKIGNETLIFDVYLGIGEKEMYRLSAPDGDYSVEITAGDNSILQQVPLTGRAIEVKKARSGKIASLNPFVWIFIILLLGFVAFITFKRGYKQTFIGYVRARGNRKRKDLTNEGEPLKETKNKLVSPRNRADFSVSIKGEKQNAQIVSLYLKNINDLSSKEGNAKESLQKIVNFADSNKASTYEGNNSIFFILSPLKTKTFKNEKVALEIAKKAKEILDNHNKIFKQKIDFGISINEGTIVAKQDSNSLKFMAFGPLMNSSKKIALMANDSITISEKANEKMKPYAKTEKQNKEGISFYTIKEFKNYEEHQKFLKSFMERN